MLMVLCGVIPERDCEQCDEEIRKMRGCREEDEETCEFPYNLETDTGAEEIRRCPVALLAGTDVWEVWEYYEDIRFFNLPPRAGGSDDQPQKLMQALRFIHRNIDHYRRMAEEE